MKSIHIKKSCSLDKPPLWSRALAVVAVLFSGAAIFTLGNLVVEAVSLMGLATFLIYKWTCLFGSRKI